MSSETFFLKCVPTLATPLRNSSLLAQIIMEYELVLDVPSHSLHNQHHSSSTTTPNHLPESYSEPRCTCRRLDQQQQVSSSSISTATMCFGYYNTEAPHQHLWEYVGPFFGDPEEEEWEEVESDDDWSMVDGDDMSDDACMCGAAVFPD